MIYRKYQEVGSILYYSIQVFWVMVDLSLKERQIVVVEKKNIGR